MKKILFIITLFISCLLFTNVHATNSVDYNLTITKDYKFKEVINYNISNYKQTNNGFNYFSTIIQDDVYTDVLYNTKYKKKVLKTGNNYNVTLSHTFSEYTFSNSNFLNTCFERQNYKYDADTISFNNSGNFNCLYADNLKVNIITDFEVTSNNAISKTGNKYTWNVSNNDFKLEISLKKTYENAESNEIYDDIEENNNQKVSEENNTTQEINEPVKNTKTNYVLIIIIISIILFTVIIIGLALKAKGSKLNKI